MKTNRLRLWPAALALACLIGGALASGAPPALAASVAETKPFTTSGTASWFGGQLHGKSTASGESFDMYAMTAAHKELPFGIILRVTNRDNGLVALVRVNDRGPYSKKRILDLSYAAAGRLGMRQSGIAHVQLEAVSDRNGIPLQNGQAFFVQLDNAGGADCAAAREHLDRLIRSGVRDAAALLREVDGTLALGPYPSFQDAETGLRRIGTVYPRSIITLAEEANAVLAAPHTAAATPPSPSFLAPSSPIAPVAALDGMGPLGGGVGGSGGGIGGSAGGKGGTLEAPLFLPKGSQGPDGPNGMGGLNAPRPGAPADSTIPYRLPPMPRVPDEPLLPAEEPFLPAQDPFL